MQLALGLPSVSARADAANPSDAATTRSAIAIEIGREFDIRFSFSS
jgi:hypothetical protein